MVLLFSVLQPRLFEDAVECPRGYVKARLASDRDGTGLRFMLKLPMAPSCSGEVPAILFQQFDNLSNLHALKIRWAKLLRSITISISRPKHTGQLH